MVFSNVHYNSMLKNGLSRFFLPFFCVIATITLI